MVYKYSIEDVKVHPKVDVKVRVKAHLHDDQDRGNMKVDVVYEWYERDHYKEPRIMFRKNGEKHSVLPFKAMSAFESATKVAEQRKRQALKKQYNG